MSHAGLESLPFYGETDIGNVLTREPLIDAMERALISLSRTAGPPDSASSGPRRRYRRHAGRR